MQTIPRNDRCVAVVGDNCCGSNDVPLYDDVLRVYASDRQKDDRKQEPLFEAPASSDCAQVGIGTGGTEAFPSEKSHCPSTLCADPMNATWLLAAHAGGLPDTSK